LVEVVCDAGGEARHALAYEVLTGPAEDGDVVILNTGAVDLGLGTGGWDFVVAVEGRDTTQEQTGRAVKLRYTPLQTVVEAVEESHAKELATFTSLNGAPVVLSGLHSALPAIAVGARSIRKDVRIVYVMTDAAALPLAFSDTVAGMKDNYLIDATITTGQAYGGDYEAVNVFSGIASARAVAKADLVIAGMGPGNLGTGSRLGFALIEQGVLVNAVSALGGEPVVVPRVSFSDQRKRHYGVSHHTVTALTVAAQTRATVVFAPLDAEKAAVVGDAVDGLRSRHKVEVVELGDAEAALRASRVELKTMGRSYTEDPEPFRAAAAAGVYAARLCRGTEPRSSVK
jgi:hypothetical protein